MKEVILIYNPHLSTMGGGEKSTLQFAKYFSERFPESEVIILTNELRPPDLEKISNYFSIPLKRNVQIQHFRKNILLMNFEIFNSKIFLNHSNSLKMLPLARNNYALIMFPFTAYQGKRPLRFIKNKLINLLLRKFDRVLANSIFTQEEISKNWKIKSEYIYPYLSSFSPFLDPDKRFKNKISNKIVSIARFTNQNHGKRQDLLIKAFLNLKSKVDTPIELHLIGSLDNQNSFDLAYFQKLQNLSKNQNSIYLLPNATRDQLKNALKTADIYWLGTGFKENEETIYPPQFEHFGISLIEAMQLGCLPLAANRGGPKEILVEFSDELLCDDIDELVQKTIKIMNLSSESKISILKNLTKSLDRFTEEVFKEKLDLMIQ